MPVGRPGTASPTAIRISPIMIWSRWHCKLRHGLRTPMRSNNSDRSKRTISAQPSSAATAISTSPILAGVGVTGRPTAGY